MTSRIAPSPKKFSQYDSGFETSPNIISKKIEELEVNLSKVKLSENISSETQYYLFDAKKLLNFARQNFTKGFYNVSDASLLIANKCLERCSLQ